MTVFVGFGIILCLLSIFYIVGVVFNRYVFVEEPDLSAFEAICMGFTISFVTVCVTFLAHLIGGLFV